MFLYIWYMPWYVIALFFAWLIASILSVALPKSNDKKWYERMLIAFLLTLVFTLIFVGSIDTDHYMFDEDIGMWFFAPALCLPAIYFIGSWIHSKLEAARREKKAQYMAGLRKELQKCEGEIQTLRMQLQNNATITRFISLLENCGGDASLLTDHPRIRSIAKLTSKIDDKNKQIIILKETISKCE